jgi:hypothetical protein
MAGAGVCPSAPSRAPEFGVHWSEAKTLARKQRTEQAQGFSQEGRMNRFFRRQRTKRYNAMSEARGGEGLKLLAGRTFANSDRFTQWIFAFPLHGWWNATKHELWRNSFVNASP